MIDLPQIPQNVRAYFYRVVGAALVLAVLKGWVKPNEAEAWLSFAAVALAVVNTPTKTAEDGQSVLVVAVVAAVVCFVLLLALGVVEVR